MEYGKKIQIHNFVMLKYKVDKTSFIKVSSVAGDWSVSYREDNIMYATISMAKEDSHEALYNVFTAIYGTCSVIDSEFTKDVFDAIYRAIKRREDTAPLQMDDGRVLEEDRRMHEIKEEIEKGE